MEAGDFLEYAQFVGNYYGTPRLATTVPFPTPEGPQMMKVLPLRISHISNATVDRAVEEIRAIMLSEHCRPGERMEMIGQ